MTPSRRDEWHKVLEAESARWSAKSFATLVAELGDVVAYEVEVDAKKYQIEVEMLEKADDYLHVMVAVDDGHLPESLVPVTHGFIIHKSVSQ